MFYKDKKVIISFLLLLITLLATGCSNAQSSNQIIVNGTVELPGLIETNSLDSPSMSAPRERLATTNNTKKINTTPLQTANFSPEEYIIKFHEDMDISYIEENIFKGQANVISSIAKDMYKIKLNKKNNNLINSLQNNPLIAYIEPEYLVHIQAIPNDPAFSQQQWNLKILGLETTWDSVKGSRDVTVAVIDTGILIDHPDLQGNIIAGYDFIDNDNDPTDTDPNFSHGTHVAGIIGAMTNNNEGIAGINWNIQLMPIRVIGPGGSGGYSALIAGIHWAVDNGADIINLSLAGSVDSASLKDAINYALDHNVTVVAAAGNNGSSPILYPAQYPEVISVGAIGPNKERAYYSNFGPNLDIMAPGGDNTVTSHNYNTILSTAGFMNNDTPTYQYTWSQGTSMATPHIAGLIALLYSQGINTPKQVDKLIKDTADDLGISGTDDQYGAGLIDINRALQINGQDDYSNDDGSGNNQGIIRIIATHHDTKEQITTSTDKTNRKFSLALTEGNWNIYASTEEYDGDINISVPGDNNIIVRLQ